MTIEFEWFNPTGSAAAFKLKIPTVFDEYEVTRLIAKRGGRAPTRAGFFATGMRALAELLAPDDPARIRGERALSWKLAGLEVAEDLAEEVAADYQEIDSILARNWPAYGELHGDEDFARGMRAEETARYHIRGVAWAETELGQAGQVASLGGELPVENTIIARPPFDLALGLDGLMLDRCLSQVTISERMQVIHWVQGRLRPDRITEKNLKSRSGMPAPPARSKAVKNTPSKTRRRKPSGQKKVSGSN